MAILYLISVIALWTGIVLSRKSDEKQNLAVWCICAVMLVMCVQVLCGGIMEKLGIAITCGSIGMANLVVSLGLGIWIAKKGVQAYEIKALDVISVAIILGMTLGYGVFKFGGNFDKMGFYVSVDAAAHCHFAKTVALEHRFSDITTQYFAALPIGLLMQVQLELTGCRVFDLYRSFLFGEMIYTTLSAGLFWALLRERCGEGKWQRFVPLLLTPLYWAGYPVYATLYGFSYLETAVCLVNLELILLNQFYGKKTYRLVSVIGLNLVLYGVFVSYTLFVPTAFFGAFITIAIQMVKEAGGKTLKAINWRNASRMLAVFLLPSVLGMVFSAVNLRHAVPGSGIDYEGGCYSDIYSNFILPLPFVIIGLFCMYKKKDGRFMFPILAVHIAFMALLLIGLLQHKVSVYYYTKNNSILWLMTWAAVAEAVWGMMHRTKWAAVLPLYFYLVVGCGYKVDPWLKEINDTATRVQVRSFVDLIVTNTERFFRWPDLDDEKMALFRYADEHYNVDEVLSINYEMETKWFWALTGGRNFIYRGSYEGILRYIEEQNIRYIVAEHCELYSRMEPYFDTLEVVTENNRGKIFKIPEGSRPAMDAPALP